MRIIFSIIFFILYLFLSDAFATKAEFEMIKKLEKAEREAPVAIERARVEYKSQNLRDPFKSSAPKETAQEVQSLPVAEKPLPTLTVQGIIWGGKFPQAIINNKVVKLGDTIEGARIISIEKDGIAVFFEGRQYDLASPGQAGAVSKKPEGGY